MLLTERHLQILRDIERFSRIRRYHRMLPDKHALMYDQATLGALERQSLIEEGTVSTRCGSELTGYRLTDAGKEALKNARAAAEEPAEAAQETEFGEELTADQIDILNDFYHYCRIKKHKGIVPMEEAAEYDETDIKILYELGYILYIKLKGAGVYTKGYILSEQAREVLRQSGLIS